MIWFYPSFCRAVEWLKPRWAKLALIPIAAIQIILSAYTLRTVWQYNQADLKLVNEVKQLPNLPIYTIGIEGALKAYNLPNPIISLWYPLAGKIEPNAYALINTEIVEKQFAGRLPAINWKFINQSSQIIKIKDLDGGWVLYQISEK